MRIIVGDCVEVMAGLPECSVDAVVTDPPYELGFMGKHWDASGVAYQVATWAACLRVLKPGGHLLAFGGSRTYHRMACAVEDAGFEIRDQIMWVYGSGFPKSHNLKGDWSGWGTALKPAHEPIVVARKPLIGTVAENVLTHGTGAISVDGCRVDGKRWPANFVHDGSDEVVGLMPNGGGKWGRQGKSGQSGFAPVLPDAGERFIGDSGSAARFFYCCKASRAEREAGLDAGRNAHPTVKPIALMRWLVRLVTPPGGTVLDPFLGSGTTGIACALEGFDCIGIEREAEYAEIAEARLAHWQAKPKQVECSFAEVA